MWFPELEAQEVFLLRLALEKVRYAALELTELCANLDKEHSLVIGLASKHERHGRPGGQHDIDEGWWRSVDSEGC
jgi:hypothetical protein